MLAVPAGAPRGFYDAENLFAPRFGFSLQLDGSGKTALRGGWGIYYSHYSGNIPGDLSRGPYAATTVTTNNIVNGAAQITLANPFSIPGTPGTLALLETLKGPGFGAHVARLPGYDASLAGKRLTLDAALTWVQQSREAVDGADP